MGKMLEDYDHLLNIDFDRSYQIPLQQAEESITTAGRVTEKLDGIWNFAPDVYDTFIRKKFFEEVYQDEQGRDKPVDCDFDQWERVRVPSNWNLQKEKYWFFEGTGVYTRRFQYHRQREGERVFLRIGAANYECRVWLNGRLLARHQGGFTPFAVEITTHLEENNRIILTANNERRLDQIPSVNYDWFNYGGISRSVELIRVPETFIRDFRIWLVPGSGFRRIGILAEIAGDVSGRELTVEIPELSVKQRFSVDADGKAEGTIEAEPKLWSPEHPTLYQVIVTCGNDRIEEQTGFREIRTEGKQVILNGKPIFLKGVCCHEESMENGRALTDQERLDMLTEAKNMGCNIMRLSHYPHSERMAALADKVGMMLWEEIPVYWALCFREESVYQNAQNQLKEMIIRDFNRPSAVIWGIGNENPDTDERLEFMRKLNDCSHTMDATRLTAAACLVNIDKMQVIDRLCRYVDVVAINEYYGWYYRDYDGLREILENSVPDKPLVISETGADSVQGHYGDEEELFTENHQAKMYRKQFEISEGYIAGIFPWILYDFRSPVRLNPLQDSFNRKGLIAADKKHRKMAYEVVKEFYSRRPTMPR